MAEFTYLESKGLYQKKAKGSDGKYHSLYAKTIKELKEKVREFESASREELNLRENPTVAEYANRWYKLNSVGLSDSRKRDFYNSINNHIVPNIGALRMRDAALDDGRKVVASMDGMSQSAQQKAVQVIKRIFEDAAENRIVNRSPMGKLKAAGKRTDEKIPLTVEQTDKLLAAVDGTTADAFVRIALGTGMRRGEILGLQWDCVHEADRVPWIEVRRAVAFDKNGLPTCNEYTKSEAGRRSIPIKKELGDYLKERRSKAASNYVISSKSGGPKSKDGFDALWRIVENRRITEEREKDSSPEKHPRVVRTLDFTCTAHQLRHTYITRLVMGGANIKRVQYIAGHATLALTLKLYSHYVQNSVEDAAKDVLSALG